MNARRRTPLLALGVLLCQAWAAVPVGPQRLLRPSAAFLSLSSSSWRLHHALKGARGSERWSGGRGLCSMAKGSSSGSAAPSPSAEGAEAQGKNVKPPKLPSEQFRPKQSLGQNFLTDPNYIFKIVRSLNDQSPGGKLVVELGPGPGALTQLLHRRYPEMLAVEIDPRAVAMLNKNLPGLKVIQSDVLQVDWTALSSVRGGRLSVIGNLPYHITSQILFCLVDSHYAIEQAVVTMQLEVAERIVAPPRCKEYGILSVLFQLYTQPKINFKIPPTVFYPQPKVTSALITLDFLHLGPDGMDPLFDVSDADLKEVLTTSFQQRRKMLRQSLKHLLASRDMVLPEEWGVRRPEELEPREFVDLTRIIFGARRGAAEEENSKVFRHERHGGGDSE